MRLKLNIRRPKKTATVPEELIWLDGE